MKRVVKQGIALGMASALFIGVQGYKSYKTTQNEIKKEQLETILAQEENPIKRYLNHLKDIHAQDVKETNLTTASLLSLYYETKDEHYIAASYAFILDRQVPEEEMLLELHNIFLFSQVSIGFEDDTEWNRLFGYLDSTVTFLSTDLNIFDLYLPLAEQIEVLTSEKQFEEANTKKLILQNETDYTVSNS